jgi:transposase, IS5 family
VRAIERLFERFDAALRDAGYLAMGGQIVDATVIQARRPRLTRDEKATVKGGGVPEGWSKARRAQMDTDGPLDHQAWPQTSTRAAAGRGRAAIAHGHRDRVPVFGYKNDLGIDRRHGFISSFVITDAAAHDGRQLGKLLDRRNTASPVWADSAYRSAANGTLLARRGLVPQFQLAKPRGQPMPPHNRPRQRQPGAHPGRGRARLRCPEVPARAHHPLGRPRPGRHQARPRQTGHQHDPPRLVRDPTRTGLTATIPR